MKRGDVGDERTELGGGGDLRVTVGEMVLVVLALGEVDSEVWESEAWRMVASAVAQEVGVEHGVGNGAAASGGSGERLRRREGLGVGAKEGNGCGGAGAL